MAKTFVYWTSAEACRFLKITAPNLRQVIHRQYKKHINCPNNRCQHLIVEYISGGKAYYNKEKVEFYALTRKGPRSVGTTETRRELRNARRYDK